MTSTHNATIIQEFLSTPPSRVATWAQAACGGNGKVSIHATLAGGDPTVYIAGSGNGKVSIHATLAGGDKNRLPLCLALPVSIHATLAGGD